MTTTLPTTIRHDGEDLVPADLYDPNGLPKALVEKAYPVGTVVVSKPKYARAEVVTIIDHAPHILVMHGFGSNAEWELRPTRKGRRTTYGKAETWANSSVGFLVERADGTRTVTKAIIGTPERVRKADAANKRAAKERAAREDLHRFAKALRRGTMEAVLARLAPEDTDEDDIDTTRWGDLTVKVGAVEALIEALAPGLLDTAREDVLKVLAESADGEA